MGERIAVHAAGRLVQGNERQLELIIRGLIERGHELHVSAETGTQTWDLLEATGARLSTVRRAGIADAGSVLRFRRWLVELQPRAILLSSWRRIWHGAFLARSAGVPRIVQRIGMTHPVPQGIGGLHYRHALRSLVDIIYANSDDVRASLLRDLPDLDPSKIRVQPNAIPFVDAPPAPLRAELGIDADTPIVVAVGGLSHRKGFDLLLDAFANVPVRAHLVICGQGREKDALETRARTVGVAERVTFAGQRADIPSVLAAADVFVTTSRADSLSVAMLEAMRAGLPIVATDVAGAREALGGDVAGPQAGWVVPIGDVEAIASALAGVLGDLHADETRRRGMEARRRVEQRYTVERLVDGVEAMLLG